MKAWSRHSSRSRKVVPEVLYKLRWWIFNKVPCWKILSISIYNQFPGIFGHAGQTDITAGMGWSRVQELLVYRKGANAEDLSPWRLSQAHWGITRGRVDNRVCRPWAVFAGLQASRNITKSKLALPSEPPRSAELLFKRNPPKCNTHNIVHSRCAY